MFIVFEISGPFQAKPGLFREPGVTSWRVWWLWFAVSYHPMRYDEMLKGHESGLYKWVKK